MENLNAEAVFNLMQNIVDKLDEVSAKIDIKNDDVEKPESDFLINLSIELNKILLQQNNILKGINAYNQELTNSLKLNEGTNETHNYEYIMFGKDSPLNTKFLVYIIAFVYISWSGIKYLPPYFSSQSELQLEKDTYEQFYNYLYLKQVKSKNNGIQKVEVILDKIKKRDKQLLEEYNSLFERYKNQIRKQQLENELKKLQ